MKFSCRKLAVLGFALGLLRANAAEPAAHMMDPGFADEPLKIETVLAEIQSANPQLRAARTRWEATKERLPQAAAWDDPRVGVDIERNNRRLLSYNDAEWMISQSIPVTGKISRRKQAASAEIAGSAAMLQQVELDLEMRARTGYFRLANAEAQLAVNTRTLSLLRQIIEVTRAKYESGRQRQGDVLMAETERARVEEARADLLRGYAEAQTALNSLMNHPPQAPLGHATLPEFAPMDVSLESLQGRALTHRPQIAVADARIAAAQARVSLAERDRYPDPEIRVEARQFNGSALYDLHEFDTGVFISVPWANGGKYRAAIREAKKMAESETEDRKALEIETSAMVRDVWQRLETYRHHVELFHDRLLPLARQTVDAMRTSYEVDRATLPEVLAAERTARETEGMFYDHLTEYFSARAELIPLTAMSAWPSAPGQL